MDRHRSQPRWIDAKKLALLIPATLISVNIWTGAPLLAVWVGSQIQGSLGLGMTAVFSVVVVLGAQLCALALALAWLNARYDELLGKRPMVRERYPWLQSMRGERDAELRRQRGVNAVERVLILSVVAAVLAFEVWFFFFAGSPIPSQ